MMSSAVEFRAIDPYSAKLAALASFVPRQIPRGEQSTTERKIAYNFRTMFYRPAVVIRAKAILSDNWINLHACVFRCLTRLSK